MTGNIAVVNFAGGNGSAKPQKVSGAVVPAGAQIIVCISDNNTSGFGTVTDDAGNTYVREVGVADGAGTSTTAVFRARTGLPLSEQSVYYAPGTGSTFSTVDVSYVTGLDNTKAAEATGTSSGISATPSVTSGTPTNAGDLFYAVVCGPLTTTSFTQDSTNAAWTTPPATDTAFAPFLVGGHVVDPTTATMTYAPTLGSSVAWAAVIVGFVAASLVGQEQQSEPQPPRPRLERGTAARFRNGFAFFAPFQPMGFEPALPQPLCQRPRAERGAAIMLGDGGTQAVFVPPVKVPWGYDIAVQPSRQIHERRGIVLRGDEGVWAPLLCWLNAGWEIQPYQPPAALKRVHFRGKSEFVAFPWLSTGWEIAPFQPPRQRLERGGGTSIGDAGVEAPFVSALVTATWAYDLAIQPTRRGPERGAITARGLDGADARFQQWFNVGEEIQSVQPPHPRPERSASVVPLSNIDAQFVQFFPAGWETQAVQPPHFAVERRGATQRGDDGTESAFVVWRNAGWQTELHQLPHPRPERSGPFQWVLNADAPRAGWLSAGWETQPVAPPHPRQERGAAVMIGDAGTEAPFVFAPPASISWGYELAFQPPHPRSERVAAVKGKAEFAVYSSWLPGGWEAAPVQPGHPRPERTAATMLGDGGVQAVFTPSVNITWGHEFQWQPQHPRPERIAGTLLGDSGTEAVYVFVAPTAVTWGYDIQWQPRAQIRCTAASKGKSEFAIIAPSPNWGYESQWSPLVFRPAARGAGIEGSSEFSAPPDLTVGWEFQPVTNRWSPRAVATYDTGVYDVFRWWFNAGAEVQFVQPPHPRPERSGVQLRGSDGTEAQLARFFPAGLESQSVQLPHPRPERWGSVALGDGGIQAVFVPLVTVTWGYDVQVAALRTMFRGSAIARGDDGVSAQFQFYRVGWEVAPPQPPHQRSEKLAAVARGDDGGQVPFIQFYPAGQEIASSFTPHPRPERSGALARSDDGGEAPQQAWFNAGWEVQLFLPPHPRPERAGSTARGDDGSEAILVSWLAAGWEVTAFQPPHRAVETKTGWLRGDDGTYDRLRQWQNTGWDVAAVQLPHPHSERGAAVMIGDAGTEAPFVSPVAVTWGYELHWHPRSSPPRGGGVVRGDDGAFGRLVQFYPAGWEVAPPQPPHPRPEKNGVILFGDTGAEGVYVAVVPATWGYEFQWVAKSTLSRGSAVARGDEGASGQFIWFYPAGWEIAPLPPPHPRLERGAAIARGDDGNQAQMQAWLVAGWEIQPPQPGHPRSEKWAGISLGDGGTQVKFVPPVSVTWGYDVQALALRQVSRGAVTARSDDGNQALFLTFYSAGWETQLPQAARQRAERSGGIHRGDDGTQSPLSAWLDAGWQPELHYWPHPRPERAGNVSSVFNVDALLQRSAPYGWEIQSVQPPHQRAEHAAATLLGDGGTQSPLILWSAAGWEIQSLLPLYSRSNRGAAAATVLNVEALILALYAPGWDVPPPQVTRPRPERGGAVQAGDTGTEAAFVVAPVSITWGHELQWQPRARRGADSSRGDDGVQATFVRWANVGWEVQSVQPPRLRLDVKSASWMRGDDGAANVSPWRNAGWEVQHTQPPHPRPERAAPTIRGDDGAESTLATFYPGGWEPRLDYPLHPRPERAAALRGYGNDGADSVLSRYFPAGWEVQSPPPPHPRIEKSGSVARGDDGTQGILVKWTDAGWPIQPFQPPHRAPESKAATWLRGDDGDQAQFIWWWNAGWEIQSYQPPHPRPEKIAAVLRSADWVDVFGILRPLGSTFNPMFYSLPPPRMDATSWFVGRVFTTGSRVLSTGTGPRRLVMPQGNDFSSIDPDEIITGTWDFAPWLARGVYVASIVQTLCEVVTGSDPSPESRFVGSASIVKSPRYGNANSAVQQQWGDMVAGTTYRLTATIATTDNQVLQVWAHQVCNAPN